MNSLKFSLLRSFLSIIILIIIINTTPSKDWLWMGLLFLTFYFIVKELIIYLRNKKIINLIFSIINILIFSLIGFYYYYGKLLVLN